jgi:6-phosphofructokinase 1
MESSAGRRKQITPNGELWSAVLSATGQGSLVNEIE